MIAIHFGLLTALMFCVLASDHVRASILALLGYPATNIHTSAEFDKKRAVALLISIALLVVLNPELRLLLMFVDAVGVDIAIVLIALQLRGGFIWGRSWSAMFWRMLRDWGPLPFSVPTRVMFRNHPLLTMCSVFAPVIASTILMSVSFLICIVAKSLLDVHANALL